MTLTLDLVNPKINTSHVLAKTNQQVKYERCLLNNSQDIERKTCFIFYKSEPSDLDL